MPANIGPQLTTRSDATKLTWHFQTLLNSAVCLWCLPTHMPVKQHLSPSGYLLMSTMFWLYHYCTLFIINPKAKADVRSTTATPLQYRKLVLCRVPEALPCPFYRAHGKKELCRVSQRKCMATFMHMTKGSLCSVLRSGTQQTVLFAVRLLSGT